MGRAHEARPLFGRGAIGLGVDFLGSVVALTIVSAAHRVITPSRLVAMAAEDRLTQFAHVDCGSQQLPERFVSLMSK